MGYVVEQEGDYTVGKYSIAYNFYTFTEKQYTDSLTYLINEDKYVLTFYPDKETFDNYVELGYLDGFDKYTDNYETGLTIEITKEELGNLQLRTLDCNIRTENGDKK